MPDRCDADQEGRTLQPSNLTRLIAREEAEKAIVQHLALCPFTKADVDERLRKVEIHFGTLIGFMLGSGALGGVTGAALTKLLGN